MAEVASIQEVNVLDSADTAHLALLARPELGITFTKLHCWTLTQYTKCVFLDADTLVSFYLIKNCMVMMASNGIFLLFDSYRLFRIVMNFLTEKNCQLPPMLAGLIASIQEFLSSNLLWKLTQMSSNLPLVKEALMV